MTIPDGYEFVCSITTVDYGRAYLYEDTSEWRGGDANDIDAFAALGRAKRHAREVYGHIRWEQVSPTYLRGHARVDDGEAQ